MSPTQGSLFGDEPRRGRGVGPAPVTAEQLAVARVLPRLVRLGTSSWSFPGWAGIVYDRAASESVLARTGLTAYARHPLLKAVGIDRTFYAPLSAHALAAYAQQVPEDFRFVVKAPARCTSPVVLQGGRAAGRNELYLDPAFAQDEAAGPFVEGLGAKGGALVFQFPPQGEAIVRDPALFAARLYSFLAALPSGPAYAVEIRDRKLFGAGYLDALRAAGVAHCVSVHPRMPPVREQYDALGGSFPGPRVVRWMLGGGLGYEEAKARYAPFARLVDEDPDTREALARVCAEESRMGHPVLVIVNNKAEGSSPLSVFRLAERMAADSPGFAG